MHDTPDYRTPDVLELLGYADLEVRVHELQRERDVLSEICTAAVHQLHSGHRREQRLRELVREQTSVIKALRASLSNSDSENRRAA